jgi:hypothetical protein
MIIEAATGEVRLVQASRRFISVSFGLALRTRKGLHKQSRDNWQLLILKANWNAPRPGICMARHFRDTWLGTINQTPYIIKQT